MAKVISRYGRFTEAKPEGMLRPIIFPSLTSTDVLTGDGRLLVGDGGGVRSLPRTIFAQYAQMYGHLGSVPVGSLSEVTFESNGNVSGRGWLIDNPLVSEVWVPLIATKTLFHNSVDLAEITMEWGSDDWMSDEFWDMHFTTWNIAATTIVGMPAFPGAHAVLDEETAALIASTEPLVWEMAESTVRIFDDEETASAGLVQPWAAFNRPEPDHVQPHTVDSDGNVYGHLADRERPHGSTGRRVPEPASYNSFNRFGVLTERGIVRTGPIFFLGGHPDRGVLKPGEADKAYGGVENAWCDVRVTPGRFGPWYCGRVRPGTSDDAIYTARGSGISGHWLSGNLEAIVSVNVPAYNVAAPNDDQLLELVASLHGVEAPKPNTTFNPSQLNFTLHGIQALTTLGFIQTAEGTQVSMLQASPVESCAAVAKHSTATVKKAWDAAAEVAKLSDDLTVTTANKMFAWVDTDAVQDGEIAKSACKFPHHVVDSGGIPGAANVTACTAGIAVLNGGRGGADISDDDRQGVYNHLAGHIIDANEEAPELMSLDEIEASLSADGDVLDEDEWALFAAETELDLDEANDELPMDDEVQQAAT